MTSWAFNSGERTKEGEGETLGPAVSEEEDEAEKSVVLWPSSRAAHFTRNLIQLELTANSFTEI